MVIKILDKNFGKPKSEEMIINLPFDMYVQTNFWFVKCAFQILQGAFIICTLPTSTHHLIKPLFWIIKIWIKIVCQKCGVFVLQLNETND